nr:hypothetical protein CFP56_63564 [Quercus suber]
MARQAMNLSYHQKACYSNDLPDLIAPLGFPHLLHMTMCDYLLCRTLIIIDDPSVMSSRCLIGVGGILGRNLQPTSFCTRYEFTGGLRSQGFHARPWASCFSTPCEGSHMELKSRTPKSEGRITWLHPLMAIPSNSCSVTVIILADLRTLPTYRSSACLSVVQKRFACCTATRLLSSTVAARAIRPYYWLSGEGSLIPTPMKESTSYLSLSSSKKSM